MWIFNLCVKISFIINFIILCREFTKVKLIRISIWYLLKEENNSVQAEENTINYLLEDSLGKARTIHIFIIIYYLLIN
jgi:hypothetical protein